MTQVDAPKLGAIFADGTTFEVQGEHFRVQVEELGKINLRSGQLCACDPFVTFGNEDAVAYSATVPPGSYPIQAAKIVRVGEPGSVVVAVKIVIWDEPAFTWEVDDDRPGYPVETGAGCFIDLESVSHFQRLHGSGNGGPVQSVFRDARGEAVATILTTADKEHSMAVFSSGPGDGYYPTWIGRGISGEVVCFVTQFMNIEG